MRVSPQCTHAKFLSLQTASAFFLLHFLYLLHFLPHGLQSRAFFHFLVQQVYQRAGRPASDVDSELVAQYVEKSLLTDEAAIRDICVSHPTAARRILNWLDGILAKMGNQKAQERAAEREFLEKARSFYQRGLAEANAAEGSKNAAPVEAAESTAVNDDPAQHTAAEQQVIEAYKDAVDGDLVSFVENSVANRGENKGRYYLNEVSERAAADIQALTGVDVRGFRTAMEQRMAEHIYKEHGPNGTTDQSMADLNDIGRIQYVLDNYDSISHGGRAPSYTTVKPNGKTGTAQTVRYEKAVNGTFYVVEAVPDTNAKTAFIVSAYMTKKKGAASQLQTADELTSAHTAKTENADMGTSPAPNVAQTETDVKARTADAAAWNNAPHSEYSREYDRAGETALRNVADAIRSGKSSAELLRLSAEAKKKYYEVQASVPRDTSYTDQQTLELHRLDLEESYFESASRDPQGVLAEIDSILGETQQQTQETEAERRKRETYKDVPGLRWKSVAPARVDELLRTGLAELDGQQGVGNDGEVADAWRCGGRRKQFRKQKLL